MAGASDDRDGEYWDNTTQSADENVEELQANTGRDDFDREAEPASRLPFEENEDRLPWLEADDEPYENSGSDIGRIVGFFLLGIVLLAALVGGIWWATHRQNDPALVADGSVIEAPNTGYKAAPQDPGGKTFEGTGDTSYEVSAGKTPSADTALAPSIDTGDEVAALGQSPVSPAPFTPAAKAGVSRSAPPVASTSAPAATAKPSTAATALNASEASGPSVQVGAYTNRASAEAGWSKLQARSQALQGVRYRVVEGRADIGTVFRLQAIPGDRSAAQSLCSKLKSEGIACQVK